MPRIVIDTEKCKNCGICIAVCPQKIIGISKEPNKQGNMTASFNDIEHKCLGCALCAISCPEIAIKEVYK